MKMRFLMTAALAFTFLFTASNASADTNPDVFGLKTSIQSLDSILTFTQTQNRKKRTVYYLPYANYIVNKTGRRNQGRQTIFIGTVERAVCTYGHRFSYKNNIAYQFTQHIEAYHTAKLGKRRWMRERTGYWRFDSPNELVGLRARIAKRYPIKEFIGDFRWYCK